MNTSKKAKTNAEFARSLLEYMDDKGIHTTKYKRGEFINHALRLINGAYSDGYYDGQKSKGVELCRCLIQK